MLATRNPFFGTFALLTLLTLEYRAEAADTDPTSDCLWPGHVSFELGYKRSYLGEGDANGLIGAGPVDQFSFAGLDFDIRRANWPISLALQTQFAAGGGKYTAEAG